MMKRKKDTYWLMFPPVGGHPHQVCMEGNVAPGEGENPEHWRVRKVVRHSHDPSERFDEKTGRWKRCPIRTAEHEARERQLADAQAALIPDAVIDALAERLAARAAQLPERKGE